MEYCTYQYHDDYHVHEFVFLTSEPSAADEYMHVLINHILVETRSNQMLRILLNFTEASPPIQSFFVRYKTDIQPRGDSLPRFCVAYLHNMQPNLISQVQTMARLTQTEHYLRGFFNVDERETAFDWLLSNT